MTEENRSERVSTKTVVYTMPGTKDVTVRRDEAFAGADAEQLMLDLYYPPDAKAGASLPVVVIVAGYPDPGYQKAVGCRFKDMAWCTSWGRLLAASGLACITYTNREPTGDFSALLDHVHRNAPSLGVDGNRIGLLAASGSVPLALSVLLQDASGHPACAALCYGFMLDGDGSTAVADASSRWGFVNPCAGKTTADLARDIPIFIARAGQDQFPGLNETLDRFVTAALTLNLPVTCTNLPSAPHAFDLFDDRDSSHDCIRQVLAFLRFHLAS